MYLNPKTPIEKNLAELAYSDFVDHLMVHRIYIPPTFHETVFESVTPRIDAAPIINRVTFTDVDEITRASIWLDIASSLHNRWIQLTAQDFADSLTRYHWMPFELIGIQSALEFGQYATRLMELLYLAPHRDSIAGTYANIQRLFLARQRIGGVDTLIEYVARNGVRCIINGELVKVIILDAAAARGIVEQLLEQGINFNPQH